MSKFHINRVELLGNIGKNIEYSAERDMLTFSIVTESNFKKDNDWSSISEWHNIVFFGEIAKSLHKNLHTGMKFYVIGELRTKTIEKDGIKRYYTSIKGNDYRYIESLKKADTEQTNYVNNDVEDSFEDVPF